MEHVSFHWTREKEKIVLRIHTVGNVKVDVATSKRNCWLSLYHWGYIEMVGKPNENNLQSVQLTAKGMASAKRLLKKYVPTNPLGKMHGSEI